MKLLNDPKVEKDKKFLEIKRAGNKKYYMQQAPKLYYFEDNHVGQASIDAITDFTPHQRL